MTTLKQERINMELKIRQLEAEAESLKHDWIMCDEVCDQKEFKIRQLKKVCDRKEIKITELNKRIKGLINE